MGFIRNQVSNKIPNRSDIKTSLYYPYVANYSAASAASPGIDSYTKLMLHMDGSNITTTFTDSALTPKTVTANGNARIQTQGVGKAITVGGNAQISTTQKKIGSSSAYFDGTGDYLTVGDSDDWNFGSGNFTIEFWIYLPTLSIAIGESMGLYQQRTSAISNASIASYIYWDDANYSLNTAVSYNGTTSNTHITNLNLSLNQWYHIAIVRNGTSLDHYINGTKNSSSFNISTNSLYDSTASFTIGSVASSLYDFRGYMDEFRVSKGIARYTASFTPSTTAFVADSYTKLLLHFEAPNTSTVFIDDSLGITPKFGTGLGYFDGSGDYLTVPDSDDWHFTGDLTIDLWVYPSANSTGNRMLFGQAADNFCPIELWWQTDRVIKTYLSFDNTTWVTGTAVISSTAIALGTWTHIALVRSGSTFTFYLNGTQSGLKYNSTSAFTNSTNSLHIAYDTFNGYMDELRISNGIARYTTTFTPSTAPYST